MRKTLFLIPAAAALALGGTALLAQGGPDGPRAEMFPMKRADAEKHAAEMFARMDANKDGKLTEADREARHAEHFAQLDTNGDGQISKAEFAARPMMEHGDRGPGMGGPEGGPEGGHGGEHGGREGKHGMHGGRGGEMMQLADANKDGAITKAEFTAQALKRFDTADANKDGTVTADEAKAAHEAHRSTMQAGTPKPTATPKPKSAPKPSTTAAPAPVKQN